MLYTYEECKQKYKTDYELRKRIEAGELSRVERGVYSDEARESELAVISKLYPYAVFTLNSAFYYHGLTDTIPQSYYLITDKNATKIKDPRVKQFFDNNDSLELGRIEKEYNGDYIFVFNKERMLVELIRNRGKFAFDYYKEIISNYRKQIYELDIQAIEEYAEKLPKTKLVMNTLRMEVF
jgi:hypothetical protein